MDHHLADSTQDEVSEGEKFGNRRNGFGKKTVLPSRAAGFALIASSEGLIAKSVTCRFQSHDP